MSGSPEALLANKSLSRLPVLAHFVVRALRYEEVVNWHRQFFNAEIVFANELATFLTYDEEHHRIAVVNRSGSIKEHDENRAGIDHVAFSYANIEDLLITYVRLRDGGIRPIRAVNHGPTTSFYYKDPDGNRIELQVDNFATSEDTRAFFDSSYYKADISGINFDPDEFLAKVESGADIADLLRRADVPPQ
ncbi:VOC family protein [Sphingobium phenoxybenzoativorans]|uniref:VOC family protein n=1 Tax=Sphingobium phenoxybenzoativorans TaxID=1592790 RepID=A0A975KCT6_9SPHN|nr:VOC family protein [Sphingobium phenoxybenzoativorans]QUT07852.1 VOC family protein [Sphingobium phenoxybenzoativorans]